MTSTANRPLRFCMVTTFYPPYNFGGDGIAVRRLATALAERGHHVEVAHCVDSYDMLRPPGVPMPSDDDYDDHPAIVHHGLRSRAGLVSPLITQQTATPGLNPVRPDKAKAAIHFARAQSLGYGPAAAALRQLEFEKPRNID